MKKLLCILMAVMMAACLPTFASAEGNDKIVLTGNQDGAIARGGTLTLAKSKGMDAGLNIAKISDCSSDFTVMGQIYEGLLTIDENGNVAPGLAVEWDFEEDGLSMVMKLREDVSFSNGEKFNAEAVAKCLNWYISEECGHVFKGSDLNCIAGVDVVDEYTVRINLSAVDAALTLELAASSGYIMAPSIIKNRTFDTTPIGTGPFMLAEYKEGESVTLVRNPNYYKMGADGQPLPYLDGIRYIVMKDDTTKTTNLQSGDIDGVDRHASYTSVLAGQAMDGMTTYQNPVSQIYNISCNLLYEPLKDVRLRQAIAYATNPQEIIEVAMEGFGKGCPFWTDEGKWFYYDYNPYSYDVEKAKALMAEAGLADGIELEVAIIAREPDMTVAQMVQYQLGEIGITININAMDSASWVAYVRNEHKEQLSIGLTGNAGYHPAKGWVIPLKAFGDVGTGLDIVEELMSLVKESKVLTDQDAAYENVKKFQSIILDNALATVIGNKYEYGAIKSSVHDVRFNYYGWYEFDRAWMEQ